MADENMATPPKLECLRNFKALKGDEVGRILFVANCGIPSSYDDAMVWVSVLRSFFCRLGAQEVVWKPPKPNLYVLFATQEEAVEVANRLSGQTLLSQDLHPPT